MTRKRIPPGSLVNILLLVLLIAAAARPISAQGGPPMRTDDPGTPGNGNFEVNVALTSERRLEERVFEAPLLDVNYGLGERTQLKFEVPFVIRGTDNGPTRSGLGNSLMGVKWRFIENKRQDLQVSTYPQLEFNNPTASADRGLVERGVRFLLPLEVTKKLGPVELNGEAGYAFEQHGGDEWIAGIAAGREVTKRLEVVGELYGLARTDGAERDTTVDFGARYKLRPSIVLLVMAGRSIHGRESEEPQFVGYGGVQFLFPAKRKHAAATRPECHTTPAGC